MKTLVKYHACNHCVIGKNTFKNTLIGPSKLPGLSRNGPQASKIHTRFQTFVVPKLSFKSVTKSRIGKLRLE